MASGRCNVKIDTSVPHIGRIYDYVLGGHHNYDADRKAADAMVKLMPGYPAAARLNRWFLQLVGSMWAAEGRRRVLDVASGLPTQGHFNEHLPSARILFSDCDPVSVSYGQEVLAGAESMRYVQADLRDPGPLLAEAAAFFGADRDLAVGVIGIVYLISDEDVSRLMRALHAFCAPGSVMAFTFSLIPEGPRQAAVQAVLDQMAAVGRIKLYFRTPERMAELIAPWRMRELRKTERWLGIDDMISEKDNSGELWGVLADH